MNLEITQEKYFLYQYLTFSPNLWGELRGKFKKKTFLQFSTDFFKNLVLYAKFKKKTIDVEFFEIGI